MFFESSLLIMFCCALDLLLLAKEPLSLDNLDRLIASAPRSPDHIDTDEWRGTYCRAIMVKADEATENGPNRRAYEKAADYVLNKLAGMDERTRSNVIASLDAALFQLGRDPGRHLLDTDQRWTFVPEMLREGAIIIIDCSIAEYGALGGKLTKALKRPFKDYLRRRQATDDSTRPILVLGDECQQYVTLDDADFQQIARSNRVIVAMLTQSIDNLEIALGSEAAANSLANALTIHIYHATSGRTATWIEQRVAQFWRTMRSISFSSGGIARGAENSRAPSVNQSEHMYPQLPAAELARLRTGGPLNNYEVDAYIFKPGRRFIASGAPFCRVTLRQQ